MTHDVLVVGGGPAGLSGAVALARALRSVLVVDAGKPRNARADGIHNYLTRDGIAPASFAVAGRDELFRYGGELVTDRVTSVARDGDLFTVGLQSGGRHTARRLLVTSGLTDELPDVPGLSERWGRTVLHCPYCHGWEVRGTAIGVVATTSMATHGALWPTRWPR